MPSARVHLRATTAVRRALVRLFHVGTVTVIAGFALFALTLLAVRFVVFPRVDAYRDTVTAALARQLGQPVEIAALSTGWDGWNPKIVIEGFRVRDKARDVSLLELPEVDLVVAWTSLPFFELRLKQLTLDRPRLAVRRDRGGLLHVAGIEFDPASASDDSRITDWILRQRQIVVRDALVTWNDDLRNAPQLVLDRVQFRLESRFGSHRFGLKGVPPAELAAPLDVRGEFRGPLPKDWQSAQGQLYVRLDYADVDAWREWLPLPPAIASGEGALRAWFKFAHGEAREIVADVELANVKAKLDERLPELELAHLSGRAGWRSAPPQHEFFTRELAFVTRGGQRLEPTTFTASMNDATVETRASGRAEFDRLQLEPLRDVAAQLPLPEKLRADLARFAPRGTLTDGKLRWEGLLDAPTALAASAGFDRLGVAAQDAFPGASGLSGRFDSTLEGGTVKLAARAGAIEFARLFADPIPFDTLQGDVRWERKGERTRLDVRALEFANAYAAGSVSATYRTDPAGPGEIDLTGQLVRGNPAEVHRFLPLSLHPALREWVRASLVKGTVTEARVKLLGNLAAFPFTDPKRGQFVVTAKGRGLTFAYAPGWPAIEDGEGEIRFEAAAMTVDAAKGRTFGLNLGRTRATIADLRNPNPQLTLDGTATGPLADFLRFVETSPVAGMIEHVTDGATGTGNGRLALKLTLPVKKPETAKVNGGFLFANGELRFPDLPPFTQINGELEFSERDVRARDVALDVMGGPAKMSAASAEGRVRVTASGTANLAQLRRQHPSSYLNRVSGTVEWSATANVRPGASSWVLESPLKGAAVDLPAPLGKVAGDAVPLRVERRGDSAPDGEDRIDVSYGRVMQIALHRKLAKSSATIDRALVSLGRAATRPDAARAERSGLWVRAELPALNVDDWLALRERDRGGGGAAADAMPPLAGIDLDVGDLDLFGRRWIELKATARQSERDWKLDLRGRDVAGTAVWSTPDASMPNGRVVARLARFAMPGASESASAADKGGDAKAAGSANPWPELDVAADAFSSKGRDLGKLELVAKPQGTDWRIEKLVLASDSGRIEADGAWRTQGREQTKLDVALDASDAGAFLARFGYADALQGAPTHIDGQLAWSGAPSEFDYPTLNGKLNVAVGPGRFVKIEPGFGKLLGVLSLQSLPRRISLDFRDIFSEGFAFDDISGNVRVVNGVMSTDNLLLMGPAAKVNIAGDADLAKETQRLTVRVQPALSGGVSAGAALLFLANPIVGAAVGAGSLLAQKVMRDPIEQMFSYQYTVTGGWSDPVVTRTGTAMASVAPGTPGAPADTTTK